MNAVKQLRFLIPALVPALIALAILSLGSPLHAQSGSSAVAPAPHAKTIHLKHVLVIAQTKGFEHDSIPAAMTAIFDMGQQSGLWDTTLRTDTELITKKDLGRKLLPLGGLAA